MEKSNNLAATVFAPRPFQPVEREFFTDQRARERELKRIDEARTRALRDRAKNSREHAVISEKIERCGAEMIDLHIKLEAVNISLQDALVDGVDVKSIESAVIDFSRDLETLKNAKIGFERKINILADADKKFSDEISDVDNRERQIVLIGLACQLNDAFGAIAETLWRFNGTLFDARGQELWNSISYHHGFRFTIMDFLPRVLFRPAGLTNEQIAEIKSARPYEEFYYLAQRDHASGPNDISNAEARKHSPFLIGGQNV